MHRLSEVNASQVPLSTRTAGHWNMLKYPSEQEQYNGVQKSKYFYFAFF